MAHAKIQLVHTETGVTKNLPVGLSWTILFFGILVPMFRKDLKWFMIIMLATAVSFGTSNLLFLFAYNKFCIKGLLEEKYRIKEFTGISEDELGEYLKIETSKFMFKPEPEIQKK